MYVLEEIGYKPEEVIDQTLYRYRNEDRRGGLILEEKGRIYGNEEEIPPWKTGLWLR